MPVHSVRESRPNGFTITETIVVVAIIGTILAIAAPYFGQVMRRARLESEARQVDMALLKARLEAIKRGNQIGVEVSTDSSKDSYQTPVIYIDSNADGSRGVSETVLARFKTSFGAAKLKFLIDTYNKTSPGTASTTFQFTFTPFGSASSASTAKAVFIEDSVNNIVQIGVPTATSGKVAMTKQNSAGSYVGPPWEWY